VETVEMETAVNYYSLLLFSYYYSIIVEIVDVVAEEIRKSSKKG